jgi:hypothetical protein
MTLNMYFRLKNPVYQRRSIPLAKPENPNAPVDKHDLFGKLKLYKNSHININNSKRNLNHDKLTFNLYPYRPYTHGKH